MKNFFFSRFYDILNSRGSVSEWFKEHAWKACERATVPEVRILSLPPSLKRIIKK